MKLGGESDPRNKTLMKMFNLIDIGERAGSGVPELFMVWEKEGWEEPRIDERLDSVERTIVTLSFRKRVLKNSAGKKVSEKTKMQYKNILAAMEPSEGELQNADTENHHRPHPAHLYCPDSWQGSGKSL